VPVGDSEINLVREFLEGNDLAFIYLYNRHKHGLYLYCLKMLGDSETAKDLVQEVFLKVYERRAQLVHPDSFRSWLYTIARNDCISTFRKQTGKEELPEEIQEEAGGSFSEKYDRKEEAVFVAEAISRLKPELKEVIILREYQNLSYREIAEIQGTTETVVKSRLYTARQTLYQALKTIFSERRDV